MTGPQARHIISERSSKFRAFIIVLVALEFNLIFERGSESSQI